MIATIYGWFRVRVAELIVEILYSSVNGDSQVQTVYGNVLQLVASNVNIAGPNQTGEGANEEAAGILKQIELKGM